MTLPALNARRARRRLDITYLHASGSASRPSGGGWEGRVDMEVCAAGMTQLFTFDPVPAADLGLELLQGAAFTCLRDEDEGRQKFPPRIAAGILALAQRVVASGAGEPELGDAQVLDRAALVAELRAQASTPFHSPFIKTLFASAAAALARGEET